MAGIIKRLGKRKAGTKGALRSEQITYIKRMRELGYKLEGNVWKRIGHDGKAVAVPYGMDAPVNRKQ